MSMKPVNTYIVVKKILQFHTIYNICRIAVTIWVRRYFLENRLIMICKLLLLM
nr:MAG TPA: hypothetical protein [Caudoviricetes sp.]